MAFSSVVFGQNNYYFFAYVVQWLVSCDDGMLLAHVVWNVHKAINDSGEVYRYHLLVPGEWVTSPLLSQRVNNTGGSVQCYPGAN